MAFATPGAWAAATANGKTSDFLVVGDPKLAAGSVPVRSDAFGGGITAR